MPFDPREAIQRVARGDATAWDVLWAELHHQGDVGEASYAAVPELLRVCRASAASDWNLYALAAVIEDVRHDERNPALPDWLQPEYEAAWQDLQELALAAFPEAKSQELIDSLLAVLALAKGRATLGRMAMLCESEREEMLGIGGWG